MDLASLLAETAQQQQVLKDRAIHLISGEIGEDHLDLCNELLAYHFTPEFKGAVTLIINSPGGSCEVGWAIIDVMNFVRYPIQTVAVGTVASMAADIFAHGDFRVIGENSTIMIHPHSSAGVGSHTHLIATYKGDLIEHERRLKHYTINSKYKTPDEVQKALFSTPGDDLYLTPKEVLAHGLADEIAVVDKEARRQKAKDEFRKFTKTVSTPKQVVAKQTKRARSK
jgi:ATP-dependent Clp protease protease subunit